MPANNSTRASVPNKPVKPYAEYPLYAHATGRWAKRIRGKIHYFGPWSDPDGALAKYLEQKDDLHAGRTPRASSDAWTITDVANAFLEAKDSLVEAGELSPRTFAGYKIAANELRDHLGKKRLVADLAPEDFVRLRAIMAQKWGHHRLGNTIQCIRSIFKFAFEAGLIPTPVRVGPGFKRPSKRAMRLKRAEEGPKLLTAEAIRQLIDAAGPSLKAMILLGVNCGFGNGDCAALPITAVDLDRGWIDFPRPKTGIQRRAPLWPETVQAIREVLARRKEPKDEVNSGLLFITKYGLGWSKAVLFKQRKRGGVEAKEKVNSPISAETAKLLEQLGLKTKKGIGFYTLRHTFRTVADEAKDQPAADFIMGHEVAHMSAVYRESISDERLKAVTDHVHAWLFGKSAVNSVNADQAP